MIFDELSQNFSSTATELSAEEGASMQSLAFELAQVNDNETQECNSLGSLINDFEDISELSDRDEYDIEPTVDSIDYFLALSKDYTDQHIPKQLAEMSSIFQSHISLMDKERFVDHQGGNYLSLLERSTQTRGSQIEELEQITRSIWGIHVESEHAAHSSSPSNSPCRMELSNLEAFTSSLLSTFTTIAELLQYNKPLIGETGRRLQLLRSHCMSAMEELQHTETSKDFIADFENKDRRDTAKYSDIVRVTMEETQDLLEQGWNRARDILG